MSDVVKVFLNCDNCREDPYWCEVGEVINEEEKIYYTTTWYKNMMEAIDDAEKWCKDNGKVVKDGD